jgi:transposase-like protein
MLLNAIADQLYDAARHEHTETRRGTRASNHVRKLQRKAGEIRLKVQKLHKQNSETAIIGHYQRREV